MWFRCYINSRCGNSDMEMTFEWFQCIFKINGNSSMRKILVQYVISDFRVNSLRTLHKTGKTVWSEILVQATSTLISLPLLLICFKCMSILHRRRPSAPTMQLGLLHIFSVSRNIFSICFSSFLLLVPNGHRLNGKIVCGFILVQQKK